MTPTDGDEALMLCAVLLTAGEARDIMSVRLAVMRGHSAMGKTATGDSGSEWGDTVRWMRGRGMLIVELTGAAPNEQQPKIKEIEK